MMVLIKTNKDINGNIYKLLIDTIKKTYQCGYYITSGSDYTFKTSRKDINIIIEMLKQLNYNVVIKL